MASNKGEHGTNAYEIGRGKPPKHSRFQKGRSGNPGGRKKNVPNLKTVIDQVLSAEIAISENGRTRKVSVLEAILLRQAQEALQGKARAAEGLLDRYERCGGAGEAKEVELPQEDLVVLERAMERRGASPGETEHAPGPSPHLGDPDDVDEEWADE